MVLHVLYPHEQGFPRAGLASWSDCGIRATRGAHPGRGSQKPWTRPQCETKSPIALSAKCIPLARIISSSRSRPALPQGSSRFRGLLSLVKGTVSGSSRTGEGGGTLPTPFSLSRCSASASYRRSSPGFPLLSSAMRPAAGACTSCNAEWMCRGYTTFCRPVCLPPAATFASCVAFSVLRKIACTH